MASEVPDEPPCNTQETDEETIALRKKRSRRVSFADREITSVHIFNRDDDYETPPDSTPKPATEREKELLGLFSDLVDSDDSNSGDGNEDEDDDVLSVRKSFLRPMESPSPGGSSTVGSATSNDEDNFFGPVSANFIRPGRLSDCAASDDNHDITMDSTAFSMHFRSIVRSESGDLNTSTGVPLASEEKTPFQATMPSDPESFMVLTNVKKLKSPSPAPINKFSGGRDSNDMSLVGESMHRYDYGRLSPTLEALLAEGSKEFNAIPASDSTSPKLTMSAIFHDNENDCMEPSNSGNPELCNSNNHDMSGEGISIAHNKLVEATGDSTTTLIDQIMRDCLSNTNDGPIVEDFVDHQIQTPNRLNRGNKEISEVVSGTSLLNSEFLVVATGTPLNQNSEAFQLNLLKQFEYGNQPPTRDGLKENSPQDQRHTSNVGHASSQPHGSPLAGSIHSISATRQQILLGTPSSPRRALFVTPSTKQSGSVLSKGSIKQGESVPSILKSNSELKFLEPSPCASAFNNGAVKSKCRLSESPSSRACSFNTIMEEMNEGLQCQQATAPTNNLEEQLSGVGLKQGEVDCNGLGTPKNISRLSQDGGTTGHAKDKEHNDNSTEILAKFTSPSNFSHSGKKVMHHSLISVDSVDGTLVASTFNSSPTEITLDISQDKGDTDMLYKLVSPLVNRLNGKLSSPTEHKGSLLGNLKLHDQNNNAIIVSRRECNSVETVLSSSNLTATCENRTQSSSPLIKVNRLTDSLQNTSETSKNFPDGVALKLQSGSPEKNIQTAVEINRPSKYFIGEQMKVSSAFVSPDAHGSKNELLPEKIYLKLSAATNQLLSPCFDKLNVKMINMLEDKLLHQQKVNKLEMLCSEIQSQLRSQAYHESSNILLKRVAETRPLLNRIVYEKAKLQLMHVKRERLLKEVQLLRTGVWESQMLKLNWVKHPSVSAEKDTQLGDNSSSVTFRNNLEGVSDKVTTMKHEDEALEKKIKNLTKSFHVYCKIKGELSCSDTIELVNDHLKKRTCCRFIRQDIQLWEVDNLQNRNDHHNVILNYHGFICQSLTLNAGPNSSIFVANKLNDINISKNFPNMDSCSAFAFVFNHESTKKYVGPKTLAQETQRTSSLLRNLLDVVEEVQIAQLEIRNLTLTSFHSPSAKQLDLQLAFIDFDSGIKVMMTLDVTCLNCGVYPSEIVPYHLQTPTVGAENLQHRPLSAEIKVAVGNLRAGYSRVIRLCRCVSQVVQSSGRG
ncbi:uncharacterized protein LOC111305523 isoform X7 [Durio zibethinus]|uniref:Uncharacterized protein LOC111305523 isoform X7 n=1 Tax=Durio zibethinus TaxID=66656 RepID=A0A6P6A2B0_DURZI|nr:uncharacterized protein LOC111305523 isoform X7 [Durio zibethinus]